MIAAVLMFVVALLMPTEAEMQYMGYIVNGEVGGMGWEANVFVATQLRYDWYNLSRQGRAAFDLGSRWYAYKEENSDLAYRAVLFAFSRDPIYPRCRLIGSRWDTEYWKANGYLPSDAVPDFSWSVLEGRYRLDAYDCYPAVLRPVYVYCEQCQ